MPSEFRITRQVEFAETDMAGIMHFSNFFRWMEACETAFYRSLDLPPISFTPGQVTGWPRVNASCDFRGPLRFGDVAEVRLLVKRVGLSSITYVFLFGRDGATLARGELTVVSVSPGAAGAMEATPLPEAVRRLLEPSPEAMLAD